ncbi:hypothetical protein Tco_0299742 [Tanacetum coccineum]
MDAGISLVPPHAVDEGRNDDTQIYDLPTEQLGVFSAATALADAAKRRRSVETTQTYTRRRRSVSTGSGRVSTASRTVSTADVSTASELGSTAGVKAKDKGKAIMQESEPPKKVKKRVQVQMSMDEELAKKVFEEEQAKAMAEQEQERINFEAALELQKCTIRRRSVATAQNLNTKKNSVSSGSGRVSNASRTVSTAGVKAKDKGKAIMQESEPPKKVKKKLDEREEVAAEPTQAQQIDWSDPAVLRYHAQLNRPYSVAEVSSFVPMDTEVIKDSGKKDDSSCKLAGGSRKKTLSRKRAGDEFAMEVESLATKYPIVDWKRHIMLENFMYYQIIRANGSTKNYKIFSEMLNDFDKQDGDLKTLFEPDEEDEVWRNQHEYNLISRRLFDSCGIHILLMDNGIAIHMMIEKKYPLNQEMLARMLSIRLEVDHESEMAFELLRFIRSQVQK